MDLIRVRGKHIPESMSNNEWDARCWHAVWNHSPHPIALVDSDGTWLEVNPPFCNLLEYSEPELQQMRWQDITIGQDIKADEENIRRLLNGEIPQYSMYKTYITKFGKMIYVRLSVIPIMIDGELRCFMSSVREMQMHPSTHKGTEKAVAELGPTTKTIIWYRIKENVPWLIAAFAAIGSGIAAFYNGLGF